MPNDAMFIQKIEDLDEILLRPFDEGIPYDEDISIFIGRTSKKLYAPNY